MDKFEFKLSQNNIYYLGQKLKKENINKVLNIIANSIINKGIDENGYTNISATKFKTVYSNYKVYLDYLRFNGLVERSYYVSGKKSFGYRFSELFKEKIEIKRIYVFKTKTKKQIQDYPKNIEQWVLNKIKNDFNSCNIVYNLSNAQIKKTKDNSGKFIDISKWLNNNLKLANWQKRNIIYKWKSGRLYTNFTLISSHVRLQNIRFDNIPIKELDIKNSFPLMLAKYCLTQNNKLYYNYDFKNFCSLVLKGNFYSYLQQKINNNRNIKRSGENEQKSVRAISKKETKIIFQQYLNGDTNKIAYINGVQVEINYLMKQIFPNVHNIVKEIKDKKLKVYDILVNIETSLIFKIVERLYQTYPEIKILTCHDAIFVSNKYFERTEKIWSKNLSKFTKNLPFEKDYDINEIWIDNELFEITE